MATKKEEHVLNNGWEVEQFFQDEKIRWLLRHEYNLELDKDPSGKLVLRGSKSDLTHALKLIAAVVGKLNSGEVVDLRKFSSLVSLERDNALELEPYLNKICVGKTKDKHNKLVPITPMTLDQFELVVHLLSNNVDTVLTTGEAGTGKTFLTVCVAALLTGLVTFEQDEQKELLKNIKTAISKARDLGCLPASLERYNDHNYRFAEQLDNIVVLRPIVATQDIGFLPGTAEEKVEPYLKQVFAYLNEIPEEYRSKKLNNMVASARTLVKDRETIPTDLVSLAKATGFIKVELVELARGANFRRSFILGDELENVNVPTFEMLLDRAEDGCKIAFSGDIRQCDLKPGITSGLALYTDMYRNLSVEELPFGAVVDMRWAIRTFRTRVHHEALAKYAQERPDFSEQMKRGVYSHGVSVLPTSNRGK